MYLKSTTAALAMAALIAPGLAGVAGPALAQDSQVEAIAPEDVSDGQIVSFVNALIALERVRADYTKRIENAETAEQREELIAEADEVGKDVVDKVVGITPDEYLAIGAAALESEALSGRIQQRMVELREKQQQRLGAQQDDEQSGETKTE
ncbi:MAG: DUF4168 domain-containing protein [Roseovarius sp.]